MSAKKLAYLFFLIAAVLMAACSGVPADPPSDGGEINPPSDGGEVNLPPADGEVVAGMQIVGAAMVGDWNLVSLNGHDLVEGSTITATFDGLKITGQACNNYFGDTTIGVNEIGFGNLGSTEMYCEDTMDQETEYFAALRAVNAWSVEGATLMLAGDGADLVFARQVAPSDVSLEGTVWTLDSFVFGGDAVASLEAGTSISATIADGQITGNATCNSYGGMVTIDGAGISVSEVETTLMACEVGMDQESSYLQMLGEVSTWRIEGTTLTLSADSGNGLIFRAQQ